MVFMPTFSQFHFIEVFLSVGTDLSLSCQVCSFSSFTATSRLLALISLSVWMGISHEIVVLLCSVTVSGSCS